MCSITIQWTGSHMHVCDGLLGRTSLIRSSAVKAGLLKLA